MSDNSKISDRGNTLVQTTGKLGQTEDPIVKKIDDITSQISDLKIHVDQQSGSKNYAKKLVDQLSTSVETKLEATKIKKVKLDELGVTGNGTANVAGTVDLTLDETPYLYRLFAIEASAPAPIELNVKQDFSVGDMYEFSVLINTDYGSVIETIQIKDRDENDLLNIGVFRSHPQDFDNLEGHDQILQKIRLFRENNFMGAPVYKAYSSLENFSTIG